MYDNVDLFDLERFVTAQNTLDSYNTALQEGSAEARRHSFKNKGKSQQRND